jgi:hypothetical protein
MRPQPRSFCGRVALTRARAHAHTPPSLPRFPSPQHLGAGAAVPQVRDFTYTEVARRFAKAAHDEELRIARHGRGVSETAQRLFDMLLPK